MDDIDENNPFKDGRISYLDTEGAKRLEHVKMLKKKKKKKRKQSQEREIIKSFNEG